ncbi:hypothetical protein D9619_009198 [Psilocybe cf. subviscida]|uniref:CCR4-NOT transcription complex subunit 11 n=1 Tax=Psilocybe cf. subviscida TaxID=2480587 RepID=A0A8H5BUH1_9AGAR|nr:hypothetical protein D9619_009198 [Psilocybe cf. subviscida]
MPTATSPYQAVISGENIKASVNHLLVKAFSLPCSTGAMAFSQLVQPTSRFQLALDALLPILDSDNTADLAERILVSFILYSMYTPYPVVVNPFKSALFVVYFRERQKAVTIASEGGVSPNEQFVWVLWKILKGDGNDIGPYSPSTLSRCPLPTKLRAANLVLDQDLYNDLDDTTTILNYFKKPTNDNHPVPARLTPSPGVLATSEEDNRNADLVHAMKLLLAARDRVLTLPEQRVLLPLLPALAATQFITSLDIAPIIARNNNPAIAHPLLVGLLSQPNPANNNPRPFLDVLPFLPPILPTFDLYGRLLRDASKVTVHGYDTVADLVLIEVLGRFVHEAINWLDQAEQDERDGNVSDDRWAKGVQNLCRFYLSLIKLNIVDPTSDADSTEMAHFSLRNSRFEEANALYRVIATSRN